MRGGGEQIKEKREDEDLQAGGWKGAEQAGGEVLAEKLLTDRSEIFPLLLSTFSQLYFFLKSFTFKESLIWLWTIKSLFVHALSL